MNKKNINYEYFEDSIPHESGFKHVSGSAIYCDDILEPEGTIYAAIGWSTKAKARIININLKDVYDSEGVVSVVTEKDIPGINDVGPVLPGDKIFVSKNTEYYGQPIFAVAAKTTELARKAIKKAKITYQENHEPVVTIKDALKKKSFIIKPKIISKGNPLKKIRDSKNFLKGNFSTGSQEHFYLEGQISFTIPKEDNDYLIYSSTQHPSETQQIIAKMLNQDSNSIKVVVRRIGGGFGGKETQSFIFSAISTLLAMKTKLPVKLKLDRDDDIIITGKRHDFYSEYEVGFNDKGIIEGLNIKLASRCGISPDLSLAINDRALFHIDNTYYLENLLVTNYLCKTNTASNTAFRGFGGPQGMISIENIIDEISTYLKLDPILVRKNNFYKKNRNITHYGMKIRDNIINELFEELIKKSNLEKRQIEITNFNKKNDVLKKGISITPVKFGISFTTTFLNQAGALVHIYTDGSVMINHGGIEMGQGTLTKIAQLAANELGLPFEKIKITSTNTSKVPNTSASAASATTDLNGAAVLNAIKNIKKNLNEFLINKHKIKTNNKILYQNGLIKINNKTFKFNDIIKEAYFDRVSLSSSGFYSTPRIHFDKNKFQGEPFYYFTYGAAVSEVIIDTLTGENKLTQVDILHDVGKSINKSIDIGQIEGGFIQGMGWLTMEEVKWNNNGQLLTHSPSTYKIPSISDMPSKFNVNLYKNGMNYEKVVNHSKTTGEPPLMLAMSVFFAIKNAISSISDYKISPDLNAPATPEEILLSIDKLKGNMNED